MPNVRLVKSLNTANPNAIEINSAFGVPASLEVYRTDKQYVPGDRVLYLDSTTQAFNVYKCISNAAGSFTPALWKLDNVDQELNELHTIRDEIQADMIRQMSPSGVLDFYPGTSTITGMNSASSGKLPYGRIQIATVPSLMQTYKNFFATTPFTALVNGYKVNVNNQDVNPNSSAVWAPIQLSAPPVNGTRDDFVFLEVWFEETPITSVSSTNKRRNLKWRIRVVDDVDFNVAPKGFLYSDFVNATVTPQGGNTEPVPASVATRAYSQFASYTLRNALTPRDATALNDYSLHVAGRGAGTTTALKTADGFVYAIPLFRIKRRNSGGYRPDNLNGADNFEVSPLSTGTNAWDGQTVMNKGDRISIDFTAALPKTFKPGKIISRMNGETQFGKIIERVSDTRIVVESILDNGRLTVNAHTFYVNSERPDGKWADIIDKDDVIDMRNRVSLNGFNYDKLLRENFDKFLRGELTESKATVKEQLNYFPAPPGKVATLLDSIFVGNDGVSRKLTNLFGMRSNLMQSIKWVPNTGAPGATVTVSYPAKDTLQILKNDTNGAMTSYTFFNNPNPTSYYLLAADVTHLQGTYSRLFVDGLSTAGIGSTLITEVGTTKRLYIKIAPSNLVGKTRFNIHAYTSGPSVCQTQLKKLSLYEITEAEYNKILIDPGFDDAGLEKKYPYIDSMLDISTNLFNILAVKNGRTDGTNTSSTFSVSENTIVTSGTTATRNTFHVTVKVDSGKELIVDAITNYPELQVGVYQGNNMSSELIAPAQLPLTFGTGAYTELTFAFYSFQNTLPAVFKDIVIVYNDIYNGPSPFGRWSTPLGIKEKTFIPRDIDVTRTEKRKTWSDASVVDQVVDVVEPISTPQKHVTVTQATPGTWAVNDTIKFTSDNGVLTGAMDADTTRMLITSEIGTVATGPVVLTVDNVDASVAVNDVFKLVRFDFMTISTYAYTVLSIDAPNKKITVQVPGNTSIRAGDILVEYTTTSSVPTVSMLKNDGTTTADATTQFTWSGLGTNEIVGTLNSIAADSNKATFSARYSAMYPSRKGIRFLPSNISDVRVNGEKYVKSNTNVLVTVSNYAYKKQGNLTSNPHMARRLGQSTLANLAGTIDDNQTGYDGIVSKNDGVQITAATRTSGEIAQHQFAYNLIEHIQRTVGITVPGLSTADKVTWIKSNLVGVAMNWIGYGINPTGNKASLTVYNVGSNVWHNNPSVNTTATSALRSIRRGSDSSPALLNFIDSNGFIHFLVYGEPSDGVEVSSVITDYVELVVEIKSDVVIALGDTTQTDTGYDIYVPERLEPLFPRNLLSLNQAFPIDTSNNVDFSVLAGTSAVMDIPKPGEIRVYRPAGPDEQLRFYLRNIPLEKNEWYTISGEVKATKLPALSTTLVAWLKEGDSGVQSLSSGSVTLKKDEFVPFSFKVQNTTHPSSIINRVMFYLTPGTTTTEETDITFRKLSVQKGIVDAPLAPLQGRKRSMVFNYVNKTVGNVLSNPHRMLVYGSGVAMNTIVPSTTPFAETFQSHYDAMAVDNAATGLVKTTTSGNRAVSLFEYDFSHLGMSTANLRKMIDKFTFKWVGYGSGEGAGATTSYGVELRLWNASTNSWFTSPTPELAGHTESTPKAIEFLNTAPSTIITENQKIYFMVNATTTAGTTVSSQVLTSYAKLSVDFLPHIDLVKANVLKVRKETKEVKLHFPKKSYINGQDDVIEMMYDHLPVPTVFTGAERVTILAELDYVFASDLSSAVGHKQGTRHHYPNPLYRLNNDTNQVFGEFGFANIPIAADSRNVNIGSEVSVIDSGIRNNSTVQYSVPVIKKPMVFAFAYLVLHKSELKLLIVNRYTSNGDVSQVGNALNKVLLLPIEGRPYVKENDGVTRESFYTSTAWKTPTGEIQGYLNDRGEIIPTYQ